ncbi:MAG: hypothetical protein IME99_07700 [Proteobacteria bacterium]|nr:hypothetical protein [Pseudomonadota bacterium]
MTSDTTITFELLSTHLTTYATSTDTNNRTNGNPRPGGPDGAAPFVRNSDG